MNRRISRSLILFISTVLALVLVLALPSNSHATEVIVCGDIESRETQLTSLLANSGAFVKNASGNWDILSGKTFVFSGDVLDRGLGGREVLRILTDLKKRFPTQVFLGFGNREASKFLIAPRVSDAAMKTVPKGFDEFADRNMLDLEQAKKSRISRLFFVLEGLYATPVFKEHEIELQRTGKSATADDVMASLLNDFTPKGLWGEYIQLTGLAHIDEATSTLFVHGAVNESNFGRVPGRSGDPILSVRDWVRELNQWGRSQVQLGLFQPEKVPQELIDYVFGSNGNGKKGASIVTDRYFDGDGKPAAPPEAFLKMLLAQGIKRIVVGHTPTGEIPLLIKAHGIEIVMVDQSANSSLESAPVKISESGVHMVSNLPGVGIVEVDTTSKTIDPAIGAKLPSGELVAGSLKNGDLVLFWKNEKFEPQYRIESSSAVHSTLGIKMSLRARVTRFCKEFF
jgi:hypothetical protein